MSYIVPSTLIYQQLASNAGVANVTPDLDACIIGPAYNVVDYIAGNTASIVATAALLANGVSASITNSAITNTVYLGSQKMGQVVDPATIKVYFNNAYVESKVVAGAGTAGSNAVTLAIYTGTGSMAVSATTVTSVTNVSLLNVGDNISIAGAGVSGAALSTYITAINGTTVTVNDAASTLVSSATISRTSFNNLNSATSTLRVEPGDRMVISYSGTTFTSTVLTVTGTSAATTGFTLTDQLPVGVAATFTVSNRKLFNNLLLSASYSGNTNYTTTSVTVDASVVINPLPKLAYGTLISAGSVNIPYVALRTDLSGSLIEITNVDDQIGTLGAANERNPLALGVQLALANTTGRIMCVAVPTNNLAGYQSALSLIESQRVYAIVPLTQDSATLAAVAQHVQQMSTPVNASWRVALVNSAIPTVNYIGSYNPSLVNANSGSNTVTNVSSTFYLNSSNSTFITDGVVPGDVIKVTSHGAAGQTITSMNVLTVVSNQQLVVDCPITLTAVNFYVQRNLSKSQQAAAVAAMSNSFASSRVAHIQPDLVGVIVNGVTMYLPGYFLAAAISGLVSGLPAQQSLTNVGVAGISDLAHSNRYFTRAQMDTMAAAGTWLLIQEAAGTIPYSRHSLTTDMTVLQYREIQQVKNIDYVSYFFHDILKGFPGRYNITTDTLQILRTTLIAGAHLLQGKKLPKIGAPLIDYTIKTLKQDDVNKDQIVVEMPVTIPTVANYINLYLIY